MHNVIIVGGEYLNDDTYPLLKAALERAATHQNVSELTVALQARDKNGWLEFIMRFKYYDNGALTVGALQRKPGEQFEFHS